MLNRRPKRQQGPFVISAALSFEEAHSITAEEIQDLADFLLGDEDEGVDLVESAAK